MSKKDVDKKIYSLPRDYLYLTTSVQDFLPFEDIDRSMICLPGGHYRRVVEVSSINFYLKTYEERESIESMFAAALSSWDFPFAFYCQTRVLDGEEIAGKAVEDLDNVRDTFIQLKEYGRTYIDEIRKSNNNLIKKNYIIVNCDDANYLSTNDTEERRRSYASDRLTLATNKVIDSLMPLGLICRVLNANELAELLYIAVNKNNKFDAATLGDFMSDIVQGQYESLEILKERKIDLMFEGFINQLNTLISTQHNLDGISVKKAEELIKKLEEIRYEMEADNSSSDVFEL